MLAPKKEDFYLNICSHVYSIYNLNEEIKRTSEAYSGRQRVCLQQDIETLKTASDHMIESHRLLQEIKKRMELLQPRSQQQTDKKSKHKLGSSIDIRDITKSTQGSILNQINQKNGIIEKKRRVTSPISVIRAVNSNYSEQYFSNPKFTETQRKRSSKKH